VDQILVIEMNLGAPRAGFARGVFDFRFGGNVNRPGRESQTGGVLFYPQGASPDSFHLVSITRALTDLHPATALTGLGITFSTLSSSVS
jgi:hypothetical protein